VHVFAAKILDPNGSQQTSFKYEHLVILFLPPNTTSYCQPLDQGIIRSIKAAYRRSMIRTLIEEYDIWSSLQALNEVISYNEETKEDQSEPRQHCTFPVNDFTHMGNVLMWITNAYDNLPAETIRKCFIKSGIIDANDTSMVSSTIESELQDLDGTLRELQSTQVDLAYCLGLEAPSACEELLDFDGQDNECCDPDCLDEDTLVVDCLLDVGPVAETCPEDDESIEMVSIELAMESLRKLRVFVSTIGIDSMASKLVDIEFKRKLALLQSSLANDRRLEVVKNAKQKRMMDYIVRDA